MLSRRELLTLPFATAAASTIYSQHEYQLHNAWFLGDTMIVAGRLRTSRQETWFAPPVLLHADRDAFTTLVPKVTPTEAAMPSRLPQCDLAYVTPDQAGPETRFSAYYSEEFDRLLRHVYAQLRSSLSVSPRVGGGPTQDTFLFPLADRTVFVRTYLDRRLDGLYGRLSPRSWVGDVRGDAEGLELSLHYVNEEYQLDKPADLAVSVDFTTMTSRPMPKRRSSELDWLLASKPNLLG